MKDQPIFLQNWCHISQNELLFPIKTIVLALTFWVGKVHLFCVSCDINCKKRAGLSSFRFVIFRIWMKMHNMVVPWQYDLERSNKTFLVVLGPLVIISVNRSSEHLLLSLSTWFLWMWKYFESSSSALAAASCFR